MNLIIVPQAEEDIRDAAFWYRTQQTGLGQDFLVAVSEKLRLLARHPQQYPARYGSLRTVRLNRFPYLIYYRIKDQQIRVVAVLHEKRDPNTAHKRQ